MMGNKDLLDFSKNWAMSMATLAELNDGSRRHLETVGLWSAHLAKIVGMESNQADWLGVAAILHDIGKGAIPRELWLKPSAFLEQEREYAKAHTEFGKGILERVEEWGHMFVPAPILAMAKEIAWAHHENWDGSGYPRGLSGDEIPWAAQIVRITDMTDALLSKRPYKNAWDVAEVENELRDKRGIFFSPILLDAFLQRGLNAWLDSSSFLPQAR